MAVWICVKVVTVMFTIALAPLVQMLTQGKKQILSIIMNHALRITAA